MNAGTSTCAGQANVHGATAYGPRQARQRSASIMTSSWLSGGRSSAQWGNRLLDGDTHRFESARPAPGAASAGTRIGPRKARSPISVEADARAPPRAHTRGTATGGDHACNDVRLRHRNRCDRWCGCDRPRSPPGAPDTDDDRPWERLDRRDPRSGEPRRDRGSRAQLARRPRTNRDHDESRGPHSQARGPPRPQAPARTAAPSSAADSPSGSARHRDSEAAAAGHQVAPAAAASPTAMLTPRRSRARGLAVRALRAASSNPTRCRTTLRP